MALEGDNTSLHSLNPDILTFMAVLAVEAATIAADNSFVQIETDRAGTPHLYERVMEALGKARFN